MNRGAISHIEIYVSNLQRTSDFWGWFLSRLGYEIHQSWEFGRSWKLGSMYLVFVQVEEKHCNNKYHRKNVGLNHLAFHAESRADVDKMKMHLENQGINILYPDKHPSVNESQSYAVYFEDPDRIKVEFVYTK